MLTRHLYITIFSFYCLFFLSSCNTRPAGHRMVTVSILPQKYMVEKIAGDYLQVNVMIPSGMNPSTCHFNTGLLENLYDSDLCFTIGHLPFEHTHLYPVLEKQKNIPVINHSENIHLLNGSCGHSHESPDGIDPHIWLSPANVKIMATTIFQTLSKHYPGQQELFEKNYHLFVQELDRIDRQTQLALAPKQEKTFLIYHPALTYFAADYGLKQISIEEDGKEPSPEHLKEIIDLAIEKDIRLILIQSQFDKSNAQSIARQINGKVISIDPLAENWEEEINKLIRLLGEMLH